MNIDGLSEATLEKFLGRGYLHTFADLFHLGKYEEEIIEMEGFGEKSFRNLMESLERARKTTLRTICILRPSAKEVVSDSESIPGNPDFSNAPIITSSSNGNVG